MKEENIFKEGYEYFIGQNGGYVGAETTRMVTQPYLDKIQAEIETLQNAINSFKGNGNPNLNGYIAEVWHAHTFNIDAAAKRTSEIASVLTDEVHNLGSADVGTSWGEDYGLKYYANGEASARAQAKSIEERYREFIGGKANPPTKEEYLVSKGINSNIDMNQSLYMGQARLIPSEQMPDAIASLKKQIAHDSSIPERQHLVGKYQETLDKLKEHIESPKGAQSMPLTQEESKVLQSLGKEGKFDPERYNITLAEKADRLFICKNALKAGLHAVWVSALLKAIPQVISTIRKMVEDGYITESDIENIGVEMKNGAIDGFIKGMICAAMTTATEMGCFGEYMRNISHSGSFAPGLAVVVVLVLQTMGNAIQMARGRITRKEFCYKLEKSAFVVMCGFTGGIAIQGLVNIPVVSYAIGSMIGSVLGGLLFETKERFFMSLCVENGYTFFGLVEQSYEMPPYLLKKLGYDIYEYDTYESDDFEYDSFNYDHIEYEPFAYDNLDLVMMRRGIIGIRKIGYCR